MRRTDGYAVDPGWRAVFADLDIDAHYLLRTAQLPDDLLARQDVCLSADDYHSLWSALEEISPPDLPIRVAQSMTSGTFSPPLFAALCSPNLAIGSQRVSAFKRLIGPMALDVESAMGGLKLTLRWIGEPAGVPDSLVHTELCFLTQLARIGLRDRITPQRFVTTRSIKAGSGIGAFLGIEPERGESESVVFSLADAYRPFVTANEAMWSVFEPELRRRLSDLERDATIVDRVRAVLVEHLPSGRGQVSEVADRLAMSSRTLQRRLTDAGTSFQAVLRETRRDLAEHYLGNSALSGTEIAYLLGFEDSNSFFRAFSDWTGTTPGAARERLMQTS